MPDLTCDVAIIGAGTAGLAAERSARRAGAATLLIDDRFAGTTCAAVGCMPSKLLITAADAAAAVRRAPVFGIRAAEPVIDGAAVMRRVRTERDRFVAGTKESFADLPPGVMVRARARFIAPTTLALDDGRQVRARAVVIATGARPGVPGMFDAVADRVLTNETIFDLADLPASIGVIGAGPLGLELAQALARLGVDAVVFDKGNRLAGLRDEVVAGALRPILQRDLPIRLGVTLQVAPEGKGVRLTWQGTETGSACFERLLVAAGRPPQLAELGLDATGIPLDDHGTPRFDPLTLQCDGAPIFIAGDANADRPVLHEASAEGAIAGRNAASYPELMPGRRSVPFSLVFTDPPVAVIGAAADDAGTVIGTASYDNQGRARIMARDAGLVRIYADRATGRLVGAAMAGPGVDHSAHLIAWAIEQRQTARDVLRQPMYHPVVEEGLKPALRTICRQVDLPTPADEDEGVPPGA
jgi:dihydrolipoamide dehydrogenase